MNAHTRAPDQVVIISDYSRVRGGASKLALLLAETLRRRDIRVTVFSGDLAEGDATRPRADGISLRGLSGASLLEQRKFLAVLGGIWNAQAAKSLAALIEQNDTPRTIYHVHGFLQTLSPAVFQALHRVRERVVIHAHDYFLACPNGAFFDYRSGTECDRFPLSAACTMRNCDKRSAAHKAWRLVRQAVQNRLTRDFLRDSRIILIHEDMQRYLERGARPLARPSVIRNPAQAFMRDRARPEAQSGFLFVGDIHAYKGVFVLAEAARKAGVPICFAGEGVERAQLQQVYPEFRFAGWQDRTGLMRLAAEARALVVPSLGPEPFGLTLVEAIACGLPVVVSDKALLSSEVEAAGAGLAFRAGDSDHLAEQLARLAHDDALIRRMSGHALEAKGRFAQTEEDWCARILQLYRDMLADRDGTGNPKMDARQACHQHCNQKDDHVMFACEPMCPVLGNLRRVYCRGA